MADVIANAPEFSDCWVRNVYRHATAHMEVTGDIATLARLNKSFEESGYRMKELLVELVASEGFRFAAPRKVGR
jgi:hypothetical protein